MLKISYLLYNFRIKIVHTNVGIIPPNCKSDYNVQYTKLLYLSYFYVQQKIGGFPR